MGLWNLEQKRNMRLKYGAICAFQLTKAYRGLHVQTSGSMHHPRPKKKRKRRCSCRINTVSTFTSIQLWFANNTKFAIVMLQIERWNAGSPLRWYMAPAAFTWLARSPWLSNNRAWYLMDPAVLHHVAHACICVIHNVSCAVALFVPRMEAWWLPECHGAILNSTLATGGGTIPRVKKYSTVWPAPLWMFFFSFSGGNSCFSLFYGLSQRQLCAASGEISLRVYVSLEALVSVSPLQKRHISSIFSLMWADNIAAAISTALSAIGTWFSTHRSKNRKSMNTCARWCLLAFKRSLNIIRIMIITHTIL